MRSIRKITVLTFVTLLAVGSSQAQFGDVFRKSKKGVETAKRASDAMAPWSTDQERAIGEAAAAKLVHIFGLYDNPDMQHYVSMVGYAMVQHSQRATSLEYKFGILDTEAITAFSLPGGYVFITRGALANMKNEAELAGTLGHEIAHVDNRHLEKEVRTKKTVAFLAEEGASRIPTISELKNIANELVNSAINTTYSRDKEDEADRKGTELSVAAGYDPNGLKNFLTTLLSVKGEDPGGSAQRLGLWGSTHPPLQDRVSTLTTIANAFPAGQILDSRFQQAAYFGPTKAELEQMEREKAEAEAKAKAEKEAAEKAAAKNKPAAKSKSKAAPKKPQ
ncbi:MAG: M48 family metalloprotease [Acidobacteriales bacterium]|nr:M48 family metalloprotease [Terriglobales bacterium]